MSSVLLTVGASAVIVAGSLIGVQKAVSKGVANTGVMKLVPADLRRLLLLCLNNIVAPCLLLLVFAVIKDTGSLMVGVPFLMRAKDMLEDVKGKTPADTKALADGIAKVVVARQTFFRLQAFMVVALMLSLVTLGVGVKKAIPDLQKMDWRRVSSDLLAMYK